MVYFVHNILSLCVCVCLICLPCILFSSSSRPFQSLDFGLLSQLACTFYLCVVTCDVYLLHGFRMVFRLFGRMLKPKAMGISVSLLFFSLPQMYTVHKTYTIVVESSRRKQTPANKTILVEYPPKSGVIVNKISFCFCFMLFVSPTMAQATIFFQSHFVVTIIIAAVTASTISFNLI